MRSTKDTGGSRRSQHDRSADTKKRLIDATVSCICEFGLGNTTTIEVARRAGVTRGALQYQFGTRADLLIAVLDHLSDEMLRLTRDLPTGLLPVEARIKIIIRRYWTVYTSPSFLAVLKIFLGASSDDMLYQMLRKHTRNIYRINDRIWHTAFDETGLPRARLAAARRLVLSTLRGLAIGRVLGIQPQSTRHEFDLLEDMLRSVMLQGADRASKVRQAVE